MNTIKKSFNLKNKNTLIKILARNCSTNFPHLPIKDIKKGNMDEVLSTGGWHDFCTLKHGETKKDIFFFKVGERPAVSIGNPKYLSKMTHLNSRPDHLRGFLKQLVGEKTMNLINTEERKEKVKANLKPAFTRETIVKTYGNTLEHHMENTLLKWDEYTNGTKMPLKKEMSILITRNILSVMYGYEASDAECTDVCDKLTRSVLDLEFKSFGKEFDEEYLKTMVYEKDFLRNFVYGLVDKWRSIEKEKRSPCYLDVLETEDDKQFAIDNAVTFLIAGIFSTRHLFFTSIYQLSSNPDKQKKLQEELDKFVKGKNVKISDLRNLKYLNACMNESLRISPSATTTARIDEENDIVFEDGLVIPKGTAIICPIAYIFMSEKFWKDSKTFYPERFKEYGMEYSYQFNPFGFSGGRVCIGKQLSEVEAKLLIANFFKNYTSRVSDGEKAPVLTWGTGTNVVEDININIVVINTEKNKTQIILYIIMAKVFLGTLKN